MPVRPGRRPLPTGSAKLIADFIAALDLEDVTLVGNDTGGALCQLVVARHPERIGRLVLTNCDAYDKFPPRLPPLRDRRAYAASDRRLPADAATGRAAAPLAYGWLSKRPVPDDVLDSWVRPFLGDAGIRRDARRTLAAIDPALLLDNALQLAGSTARC